MMSSAAVLWITGLPASGKTTLALSLEKILMEKNRRAEVLDGDAIRKLYPKLGFTKAERDFHIKAVAHTASLLEKNGIWPIVSLVSPYEESRFFARCLSQNFVEVYLSTNLAVCQRRDPKRLYAKALRGEIQGVTGVDAPYEAPGAPEITLDAGVLSIEECSKRVFDYLTLKKFL